MRGKHWFLKSPLAESPVAKLMKPSLGPPGRFFDKLDFVARHIRNSLLKPFGGLQVIATGDFFQLPPVTQGNVDAVSHY